MSTYGIPLGALVSFGSSNSGTAHRLLFSGTGAVSADPDNDPPQIQPGGAADFLPTTGRTFAQDRFGVNPAPMKAPTVKWLYWLAATAGLGDAAAYSDLQARLNRLYNAYYRDTYDYYASTNTSGTPTYAGLSGQVGDLIVADADGTPRRAWARWLDFDASLKPGDVAVYQCSLTWQLLEHFQ